WEGKNGDRKKEGRANGGGRSPPRPADHAGLVDHARIGGEWDRSGRTVSLFDLLSAELAAG
ncbi:MAG: hypothetical protein ACKO2C_11260, partial [Actinomycetes bacterium]